MAGLTFSVFAEMHISSFFALSQAYFAALNACYSSSGWKQKVAMIYILPSLLFETLDLHAWIVGQDVDAMGLVVVPLH